MNKTIQTKLNNVLKAEAEYTMRADVELSKRAERMNTIYNMKMIVDNYDELEPVLKEFFEKKQQDKKWEEER